MIDPQSMNDPQGHGWTFSTLREYLLRVVSDLALRQSELAKAQEMAVQSALVAQEKAVSAALAAADKAVAKAEIGAREWQASANEWRGAMSDRERQFVTRKELWSYLVGTAGITTALIAIFELLRGVR